MFKTLRLYEYEIPLKRGFSLEGLTRKGLILENPEYGLYSEAAPLPLHSKESHQEALIQLNSTLDSLLKISSPKDLSAFFNMHFLCPSVLFCIYALFEQLFFPKKYPHAFPIRHYIDIPYKGNSSCLTILEKIHSLYTDSSQIFKIKLGSYPVQVAIDLMRSILSCYKASIQLDINQKWSLEEASLFFSSFDKESFHSIEDPTQTLADLFTLTKKYPHPISLDQILRTYSIKDFLTLSSLKACEFKPTLDMHSILDESLIAFLQDRKIDYTFSSSYESSIGIAAIGRLGLNYIPFSNLGIDTLGIFSHDILSSSFYSMNNQIILKKPLEPNHKYLKLYANTTLSYR